MRPFPNTLLRVVLIFSLSLIRMNLNYQVKPEYILIFPMSLPDIKIHLYFSFSIVKPKSKSKVSSLKHQGFGLQINRQFIKFFGLCLTIESKGPPPPPPPTKSLFRVCTLQLNCQFINLFGRWLTIKSKGPPPPPPMNLNSIEKHFSLEKLNIEFLSTMF